MMIKQNREAGYTLIGVLLIFTILAVLGISLTMLSLTSVKTSTAERENQSAFYIAESGINLQIKAIEKKIQEDYGDGTAKDEAEFYNNIMNGLPGKFEFDNFEKINQVRPKANVKVSHIEGTRNHFRIESIGEIAGEKRAVTKDVAIKWIQQESDNGKGKGEIFPFSIFTSGDIKASGSVIVHGDIGMVEEDAQIIGDGEFQVNGEKYVAKDEDNNPIRLPVLPKFPKIPTYICPDTSLVESSPECTMEITGNESWDMKEDGELEKLELTGGRLTIDIGDEDRHLVVNDMNITSGTIDITGTGTLHIYIKEGFEMEDVALNSPDKTSQLNMFYRGENPLQIAGSSNIHGSLYVNTADIYLNDSPNMSGNIFSNGKKLEIHGSSTNTAHLIVAPNANIRMYAAARFYGQIIAKSLDWFTATEIYFPDCTLPKHQNIHWAACENAVTTGPISIEAWDDSGDGSNGNNPVAGDVQVEIKPISKMKEINIQ